MFNEEIGKIISELTSYNLLFLHIFKDVHKFHLHLQSFSYLWDKVCSVFSGAGKFCLAHGPRQLTRDVKCEVRTLDFRSDVTSAPSRKTPNDIQKWSLCEIKCQK